MKINILYRCGFIWITLLFSQCVIAQNRLQEGDIFPKMVLNHIYNYKDSVLDLSDFDGMPLIIDFWSTRCQSCLKSFPKLDSLQKMFAGQVQFLLVNPQTFGPDSTDRLFKSRSALFRPSIPFITQDSVLTALFEPVAMPYLIWIGADGTIKHFSNNVTSNAIQQLIDNEPIGVNPYVRNRAYPTSIFSSEIEPYVEYYSGITRYMPGVNPRNAINNACLSTYNSGIVSLFQMAYNEGVGRFSRLGYTVVEVKDSTRFFLPKDDNFKEEWYANNTFSYALALPEEKQHLKYLHMQQDLERYFDVDAKVEQRKTKCYVLRSLKDADKIATQGGELISISTLVYWEGGSDNIRDEYKLQNLPYDRFVSEIRILSEYRMNIPFVDLSSPLKSNIDITFDGDLILQPTFQKLQKFLYRHGYSISEEELELEVLVLRN